jgi:MYXO-CTERM domain-containing protein
MGTIGIAVALAMTVDVTLARACQMQGFPCAHATDCCSDNCTPGLLCGSPVSCLATGSPCTAALDCCSANCPAGFCLNPGCPGSDRGTIDAGAHESTARADSNVSVDRSLTTDARTERVSTDATSSDRANDGATTDATTLPDTSGGGDSRAGDVRAASDGRESEVSASVDARTGGEPLAGPPSQGCGCTVGAAPTSPPTTVAWAALTVGLGLVTAARRRRRR